MVGRSGAALAALFALLFAFAAPAGAATSKAVIVTVRPGVSPATAAAQARAKGADVRFVYTRALRGYAATVSPALLKQLRASTAVAAVLPDKLVRIAGTQANPPSYGLDRIDQRALPLNNSYTYPRTGAGVDAYDIDTGLLFTHTQFAGRA